MMNEWLETFNRFARFRKWNNDQQRDAFMMFLGGTAKRFCQQQPEEVRENLERLQQAVQLQHHILSPTRITNITASLLDVILTYCGDNKILDTGVIHLGISDHSLVYLCRKLSIPKAPPKTVFIRHYKNYDVNKFNNDLREIFNLPLDPAILNDPNALWNDFSLD